MVSMSFLNMVFGNKGMERMEMDLGNGLRFDALTGKVDQGMGAIGPYDMYLGVDDQGLYGCRPEINVDEVRLHPRPGDFNDTLKVVYPL